MLSKLKLFLKLVGPILLIYIFTKIDFEKLIEALSKLNIVLVALLTVLFLVSPAIKSLRWFYILKKFNINFSFKKTFKYHSGGMLWGCLTPGKFGELIKVNYLVKNNVKSFDALSTVIIDRLIDIITLTGMSLLFFFTVLGNLNIGLKQKNIIFMILICMIILLTAFVIIIKKKNILWMKKATDYFLDFKSKLLSLKFKGIILLTLLSIFAWLLYAFPFLLLSMYLDYKIPILDLYSIIFLSCLISMLPISIAGIGSRDAYMIMVLSFYGIAKEEALMFSFIFVYMYLVNILFYLFFYKLLSRG